MLFLTNALFANQHFPVSLICNDIAEMAEHGITVGQQVAVVWDRHCSPEALQKLVQNIQAVVGAEDLVSVENIDQLLQCKRQSIHLCGFKIIGLNGLE